MITRRYIYQAFFVLLAVGFYGAHLIRRGIKNDVWFNIDHEPIVGRTGFIISGILLLLPIIFFSIYLTITRGWF